MDCSSDEMNQKLVEEAYAAMKHAMRHIPTSAWVRHCSPKKEKFLRAVILKMLRTVQPTVRSVRQFLKRYRKGIRRLSGLPSYHRPIRKRRHAASADRYWQSL